MLAAIIRSNRYTGILCAQAAICQPNAAKERQLKSPKPLRTIRKSRVGIYAGAFDPVHAGHVAFALQAAAAAQLDQVIFMPERRPRYKPGVEHYAHRMAMVRRALAPHPRLAVMEMVDKNYSVMRTLPHLKSLFPDRELVFLMGSDSALTIPAWPGAGRLLECCELVVGVRAEHKFAQIDQTIRDWPVLPTGLKIIDSYAPDISSSRIRQALRENRYTRGLLTSVQRYARSEWLYVSAVSHTG